MINKSVSIVILTVFFSGNVAYADNQTVSIGYAQSKVQSFKNIRGVNAQFRYEWDSPISVLGSFSYMKGDDSLYEQDTKNSYSTAKIDVKYYSLLAGPAYRFNEYVSLYGLIGAARISVGKKTAEHSINSSSYESISMAKTNLAYGVGVIVNPIENLSINLGYEGSKIDLDRSHSVNGFNIGIGYRF